MHMVLGIRGCSGDWGKGGLDGDLTTKGDIYSLITNSSSMKILNDDESASQIREFREGQASEQYWTYQAAIARSMGTWASSTDVPPSFVLAVGDNFYTKGVYSTDDPLWETYWKEVYLDNYESLRIPWLPALGNHDYGYGMDGVYAQIEKTNEDAENGYLWQFPSQYYTRRFSIPGGGSLQIIVIDSTTLAPSENQCCNEKGGVSEEEQQERISEQLASIESMLQGSDEDPPTWLLVAGHHPLYSSGRHGDNDDLAEHLKPLLEKYMVHAYLSAHDHISEHLQSNGIEYFVCGAGAMAGTLGNKPSVAHTVWNGVGYSAFSTFEATMSYLRVQYVDSQGVVKYKFTLTNPRYRGAFISILSPASQMIEVLLFLCGIIVIAIAAVFVVSDRETNINVPKRIAAIIAQSQDKLNSSSFTPSSSQCNPLTVAADSSSRGFLADVIESKRASSCVGSSGHRRATSDSLPIGVNGDLSSHGLLDVCDTDVTLLPTAESEVREMETDTCGPGPTRSRPSRGAGACAEFEPSRDVTDEPVRTAAVSSAVSFISMNKLGNRSPSIRLSAMQHSHRKMKSAFT